MAEPSAAEHALVRSILRSDFGETVELIAKHLLHERQMRLATLAHRIKSARNAASHPSLQEIRAGLLKLLQHNVLDVTTAAGPNGVAVPVYAINMQQVRWRLRFAKFMELAKDAFGAEGEIIMEQVLVRGRVRLDQAIDSMAYSLAEQQHEGDAEWDSASMLTEEELEACRERLRATFTDMAKQRYLARVHPIEMTLPTNENEVNVLSKLDAPKSDQAAAAKPKPKPKPTATAKAMVKGESSTDADKEEAEAANDGITVRAKRKKPSATAASRAIPVELQVALDAEDTARADDGEAEFETPAEHRTKAKRRKIMQRAKLPTRKSASDASAESSENELDGAATPLSEQDLVWRYGADHLIRELRHRTCAKFATEHVTATAGVIVKAMLRQSSAHERTATESVSHAIGARELFAMPDVQQAIPTNVQGPYRMLLNFLNLMSRDRSGMVALVPQHQHQDDQQASADNAEYVVHMEHIISFLRARTLHAYVQDKYGLASARIVQVLLEKKQLEPQTIGDLALLPANDTRHRLYELQRDRMASVQEIPKRADHAPSLTLYCWSVDVTNMHRNIVERTCTALVNLRRRRDVEAGSNKDLIAHSDQLVDPKDIAKLDALSRALDRLDRAVLQLDDTLMLFCDF